jgi:hypothetical protein
MLEESLSSFCSSSSIQIHLNLYQFLVHYCCMQATLTASSADEMRTVILKDAGSGGEARDMMNIAFADESNTAFPLHPSDALVQGRLFQPKEVREEGPQLVTSSYSLIIAIT